MTKVLSSMEKKAAYDSLLEQGVSFDAAVDAVEKQAGFAGQAMAMGKRVGSQIGGKAKTFATAMKNDAKALPGQVSNVRTAYKANGGFGGGTMSTIKAIGKNKAVQAGAGVTALGAAAMSRGQEKQACMQKLLAEGIDFDTAVSLVKQAEEEIYGK